MLLSDPRVARYTTTWPRLREIRRNRNGFAFANPALIYQRDAEGPSVTRFRVRYQPHNRRLARGRNSLNQAPTTGRVALETFRSGRSISVRRVALHQHTAPLGCRPLSKACDSERSLETWEGHQHRRVHTPLDVSMKSSMPATASQNTDSPFDRYAERTLTTFFRLRSKGVKSNSLHGFTSGTWRSEPLFQDEVMPYSEA